MVRLMKKEIISIGIALLVVAASMGWIGGSRLQDFKPQKLPEDIYEEWTVTIEREDMMPIDRIPEHERFMKVSYKSTKISGRGGIIFCVSEFKTENDAINAMEIIGTSKLRYRDGRFVVGIMSYFPQSLKDDAIAILEQVERRTGEESPTPTPSPTITPTPTPTPTPTLTPTPEPEQCVKYYNYEGEQIYADMFEDGQKIRMRFENGTSVFWIFESGFFATFDCSEMSAMHERQFENLGYHAKIRCSKFNLFKPRHCWVVLENENGSWTVFEATKQKIIKDDCKIKANYSSWGRESETIEDAIGRFYFYYTSFNWWSQFDEYKDIDWCPIEASTPTPEEGVPGFEAVFAIAGLLAVAYLLRRRGEIIRR